MFDIIKDAFSQYIFLGPKDLYQIATIARLGTVKQDEQIITEGDLNYKVILVVKGLLRHFVIDKNGEERTIRFAPEKSYAGSMDTVLNDKPASENIMALENSIVIKFDNREVDKLVKDNIRLLKLQNLAFKRIISSDVEQIKFLTVFTPEERYTYFCKTYPQLEQRVKQKYLASYLGITPTSLSRMRARLV